MAIYNGGLSIKNVSIATGTTGGNAVTSIEANGNVLTVNKAVHTHNYAGSSTAGGSATSAEKATRDGSGNVITDTYATKTELGNINSVLDAINGEVI